MGQSAGTWAAMPDPLVPTAESGAHEGQGLGSW